MSTKDLVLMIRETGFKPLERDTLYNIINDFGQTVFEEDEFKGYLSLPVVNSN